MSMKSFEEWRILASRNRDENDPEVAWNFCEPQYESEVEGLKTKFSEATQTYTDDIDGLEKQNEELKKKLEKAEEVIRFYGDPEKWMIKTSDSWTKSNPSTYGDSELIEDYSHPNKDWVGSIVVGGKRARSYLKENEG